MYFQILWIFVDYIAVAFGDSFTNFVRFLAQKMAEKCDNIDGRIVVPLAIIDDVFGYFIRGFFANINRSCWKLYGCGWNFGTKNLKNNWKKKKMFKKNYHKT